MYKVEYIPSQSHDKRLKRIISMIFANAKGVSYKHPNTNLEGKPRNLNTISNQNPLLRMQIIKVVVLLCNAMQCLCRKIEIRRTLANPDLSSSTPIFLTFSTSTRSKVISSTVYCFLRLVSLGPMSGLARLLTSCLGTTPIIPMAGRSGPGLE